MQSEAWSVSVVLPVYSGVSPQHLEDCLASLAGQTRPADEVVLVEDGAIPASLRQVLDSYAGRLPLRLVKLAQNVGPGGANQAGLLAASGSWIAKMDADDISRPARFEVLVKFVQSHDVDLVGSAMAEFVKSPADVVRIRTNPSDHGAIARRMRLNNPINHPSCMYRKSAALAAGGYPSMRTMEDYDLFARMMSRGFVMANLEEPLVLFRADPSFLKRRRDLGGIRDEWQMQNNLYSYGIITRTRSFMNFLGRALMRLLPPWCLKTAYRVLHHANR